MKFPRSARIFRGHLDVAPFASVFFLLIIFVLLGALIYTPGIVTTIPSWRADASTETNPPIDLPQGDDLTGTDRPTIAVAVDAAGKFYFENQPAGETELEAGLKRAATKSAEPLTLLVQADKNVAYDHLIRLSLLARDAGITNALLATLPHAYQPAAKPTNGKP